MTSKGLPEMDGLTASVSELVASVSELVASVNASDDKVFDKAALLGTMAKEMVTKLHAKIDELSAQLAAANAMINSLQDGLAAADAMNDSIQDRLAAAEATVDELQSRSGEP